MRTAGSPHSRVRQPRLRCERLETRDLPAVLSFAGVLDTWIARQEPNTPHASAADLSIHTDASGPSGQTLLRFNDLVGSGPNQIPAGSTIVRASLTLYGGTAATGAGDIALHRMIADWNAASATWASFGGDGVQTDGVEALSPRDGFLASASALGYQIIGGLDPAVRAWVQGDANRGWVLTAPGRAVNWSIASSETNDASLRPLLTVEFVAPTPAANPTYQQLVGAPPAANTRAWFDWQAQLEAQRLARVPLERSRTFFFSPRGDDRQGRGTIASPWRSLARAQDLLDASAGDVRFRFERGGTWIEETMPQIARASVTFDSYGDTAAADPLFSRFVRQYRKGWEQVGPTLWAIGETTRIGWVRETANPLGAIYYRAGSIAEAAQRPKSWFFSEKQGLLYVNAGPELRLNERPDLLEACLDRTDHWTVAADQVRLQDLRIDGSGVHRSGLGYGLEISLKKNWEFVGVGLDVYYTGYHGIGHISDGGICTLIDCRTGLCTNRFGTGAPGSGDVTPFVDYAPWGGQEFLMRDCEVSFGALPSSDWAAQPGQRHGSYGVYQHTAGPGYTPALSVALRTRFPDHPWQVLRTTAVAGPAANRLEDVRGFIVGENPEIDTPSGFLGNNDRVYVNNTYRMIADPRAVALYYGPELRSWSFNCTVRADLGQVTHTNYGAGFAWFFGNNAPIELRIENCRFDMTGLDATPANLLWPYASSPGASFLVRNSILTFSGPQPSGMGPAWAANTLRHNAYFHSVPVPNGYYTVDPGAILLTRKPPESAPSLASPMATGGAATPLDFDQFGQPRPAGSMSIGPNAARALANPRTVTLLWNQRERALTPGLIFSGVQPRQFALAFAQDVDLYAASAQLQTLGGAGLGTSAFTYDPATFRGTWTLSQPLAVGRYRLVLDGQVLLAFGVLPGDLNQDASVRADDLQAIQSALGSSQAAADLDGDGWVTQLDYNLASQYLGQSL